MTLAWLLLFVACAAVIARAGHVLSRSADELAEAHGWGRGWVGLALLATVTSLPELASGISAVVLVDAPNLAVGDALGSCVFNLAFLGVVDGMRRHQPMYVEASATHILSAGFGIVMLGFVAMSLMMGQQVPSIAHFAWTGVPVVLLYFLALRAVQRHDRVVPLREPDAAAAAGVRRSWRRFAVASLAVVAAGTWLPEVADQLGRAVGLSRSLVGTLLLALVTSLPEVSVSMAALRLGRLDMAIGNLLGSNLFNMVVLAVDDACYPKGSLLVAAAPAHVGTALVAMTMTGMVVIGLTLRPRSRFLRAVSWISVGLAAGYAVNAALIYLGGI